MPDSEAIRQALSAVKYPGFSRDIISFGIVKGIALEDGEAAAHLAIQTADEAVADKLRADCEAAMRAIPGVRSTRVQIDRQPVPAQGQPTLTRIPGVARVIAVASGKGGVGKSTVAANLACAFGRLGLATGLCDCDLYGPSIPLMFGTDERPVMTPAERIVPVERCGIRIMSMGLLVDGDTPAILRGPMVTRFTQQFLLGVEWGTLDALVLDLPPGTGDIQLTVVQTLELTGAVVVTTPQEVALIDARKAVAMFRKVNVPILGIIENMSFFLCPSDGVRYPIFGEGGGRREADRLHVPLLGQIPIDIPTRISGDGGLPITASDPASPVAMAFLATAEELLKHAPATAP